MPYSSTNNEKEQNTMTLTGGGTVIAPPDTAILRLGVQTTGTNVTEAQNENARLSQAVLQSLEQLAITDIKTFQYDINKIYDYQNNQQIDKGYQVRNILEIRTNNLDQVGELIDTAVYNGANVVELISFDVSNVSPYYLQALNLAIMNADEKAKSITENLGIIAYPIPKHITENTVPPISPRFLSAREGSFATPIESGNKQIDASVTVEYVY